MKMDKKKRDVAKGVSVQENLEKPSSLKKPPKPASRKKPTTKKTSKSDSLIDALEVRLDNLLSEANYKPQLDEKSLEIGPNTIDKEKETDKIEESDILESEDIFAIDENQQKTGPVSFDREELKGKIQKDDKIEIEERIDFNGSHQETNQYPRDKDIIYDEPNKIHKLDIKDNDKTLGNDIDEIVEEIETEISSIKQIDIKEVDLEESKWKSYRIKFVIGGLLIILVIIISLTIFSPSPWSNRSKQKKTVITQKIIPPSNKIIDQEFRDTVHRNSVTSQKIVQAKKVVPRIEKDKDIFKAPVLSYPYSIHADSYRLRPAAEVSVESYRKMGFQAFWVRVELGKKGVWYRVFIGCYKDSETAEKIISSKQLKGASPGRTRYANFIGTYLSEDSLKNQMRFLSESGYSPYFIKDDKGEHHLYVGAFYKLEDAEKLSNELSSKGIRSQVAER